MSDAGTANSQIRISATTSSSSSSNSSSSSSSPKPPLPRPSDQITEADLERVVRAETVRHIEAAWRAHQRLLHACMHPEITKVANEETNNNAKVDIDNDNIVHSVDRGNEHESDDCGDDDDDDGRAGESNSLARPAPGS